MWEDPELDTVFAIDPNRRVIEHLRGAKPLAHPDLAVELEQAGRSMPENLLYRPGSAAGSYGLLHTRKNVIYAVAAGMRELYLRLPDNVFPVALKEGAEAAPRLGQGWVFFDVFGAARPVEERRLRLASWCRRAYDYAETLG